MNSPVNSYKDLIVWQKSFRLVILVYQATSDFPKEELYVLTSQVRRAAVSIPSNIAEGYSRRGKKEYLQFLEVAFGSSAELETQLLLAKELGYLSERNFRETGDLLIEIRKMLSALMTRLR